MQPNADRRIIEVEGSDAITRRLVRAALAQAIVVLGAGLNLWLKFPAQSVAGFDLVRWREIFALLAVVPVSVGIIFHAVWILEQGRRDAGRPIISMGVFACLLGIAMGVHEPLSALPFFRQLPALEFALEFWDEFFSHLVFFLAFAGIVLSLLWSQFRNPLPAAMSRSAFAVFGGIAFVAGAGIFFSLLPGGSIRVDLAVIALVLLTAELMRKKFPFRKLPVALVIESACSLALLGLAAQRCLAGRW